jgi:hypothetical protein
MGVGFICCERCRVIGFDGGDSHLHPDRRKMKAKLPALAQNVFASAPVHKATTSADRSE